MDELLRINEHATGLFYSENGLFSDGLTVALVTETHFQTTFSLDVKISRYRCA